MTGDNFTRLDTGNNDLYARVRFEGGFQGKWVVWLCDFLTLEYECRVSGVQQSLNYIEIGMDVDGEVSLRVVLNIKKITDQEIEKMIIMIRNYKKLSQGKQTFRG